jgi:hypothetical protein
MGLVVTLPITALIEWRAGTDASYAFMPYACVFFAGVGAALGWLDRLF